MPKGIYERTHHCRYTVYDKRTDFPVIIGGTARAMEDKPVDIENTDWISSTSHMSHPGNCAPFA